MTGLWLVSYIALWILFLIVSALLISILYHLGVIYNKIEKRFSTKLTPGKVLPEVALQTLNGKRLSVSQFFGSQTAFVIISPGCSGCLKVLRAIAAGEQVVEASPMRTIVVSMRDIPATLEMARQVNLPEEYPILVDTENAIQKRWGVSATPVVVEVDNELKVSKQTMFVSASS